MLLLLEVMLYMSYYNI